MLQNWDWILFDADDTLFHFDAFAGLQRLFKDYDVEFSNDDYDEYQAVNKPLWVDYQNGAITALQLQHQRFTGWAEKLKVSPDELNSGFLSAMGEVCVPLEGAVNLMNALKGKVKMGIITNGFTALQQVRLQRTGFRDYFDLLVISEQVGYAKPHPAIFDYALEKMGNPPRERVLMVGDNPDSDILGGINAGLKTCWLNADGRERPAAIVPDWQIGSLHELQLILVS
jgi:5'-nucleotidase